MLRSRVGRVLIKLWRCWMVQPTPAAWRGEAPGAIDVDHTDAQVPQLFCSYIHKTVQVNPWELTCGLSYFLVRRWIRMDQKKTHCACYCITKLECQIPYFMSQCVICLLCYHVDLVLGITENMWICDIILFQRCFRYKSLPMQNWYKGIVTSTIC